MKRFTIVSLIIAAVFFVLGIFLTVIGLLNKADITQMWESGEFSLSNGDWFDADFDERYDEDRFTEVFSCTAEEMEGVDIDIAAGSLVIKQSSDDMFKIITSNESKVESSLLNGIVKVKEDSGRKFRLLDIGILSSSYTKTVIYLPENALKSINIVMEGGCVKVYGCQADSFGVQMKAGAFYGTDTQNFKEFNANIEAGNMEMEELYAGRGTIACNLGNFSMDSGALENADLECQMGNIEVLMKGEQDDYQYDVNVEMGNTDIDGESYSAKKIKKGSEGNNEIKIDCEMGNVTVDFEE